MTDLEKAKGVITDYFGEDRVDFVPVNPDYEFSDVLCTVWFPTVAVSNEHNESHLIRDLFVRFSLSCRGTTVGTITMNRTTYTKDEVEAGYIHSHCNGYPSSASNTFYYCCLGTGPLVSIISSLAANFDENMWMLFCAELDSYTKVESISGVPYRRMSAIGNICGYCIFTNFRFTKNSYNRLSNYNIAVTRKLLLDKAIPLAYNRGMYRFALPDIDVFLIINNACISMLDEERFRSLRRNVFNGYVEDNYICRSTRQQSSVRDLSSGYITFKNRDIYFTVLQDETTVENHSIEMYEGGTINIIASMVLEMVNC